MATALKTVCFPFPNLAAITEASVTNFTQISVTLPESSIVFRSVWVECMANDLITVTGGTITEWRIGLRLGAAAYTTVTNTNDITNSGEQMSPFVCADFTAHFTTNWAGQQSGGVATCDVQLYLDQSTGTTLNFVDGSAMLWITYEYDDTSATQLYTCFIPFDSPTGALGTAKPGSPTDTIPNLDSFLGYASISYKSIKLIAEGNEAVNGSTASCNLQVQVDSLSQFTGSTLTAGLASDRYFRIVVAMDGLFTTNATHSLYVWNGTTGRMNHLALMLVVTFTFDASSANDGNRSLLIPAHYDGPMGGVTSGDYQRTTLDLWIEEGATIVTQKSAHRITYDEVAVIGGLNFRVQAQSFVAYTDAAVVLCGGSVLQRTCDAAITLARGKNTLTADVYRTDTVDFGHPLGGLWIINYKCAKPTGGWGRANRSVGWGIQFFGTGNAAVEWIVSAIAPVIPEAAYLISGGVGAEIAQMASGSTTMLAFTLQAERLSGESGIKWEEVYADIVHTDPEVGVRITWGGDALAVFKRWASDPTNRLDLEQARRWRFIHTHSQAVWPMIVLWFTYHSITFAVSGNISASAGGTVNIYLLRVSNKELLLSTSRSGNGAYSFSWYDNTENLEVVAYEDATHQGASDRGVAT